MSGDLGDQRKAREREFHDDRFTDETRQAAGKYYAVDAGKRRYRELVTGFGAGARVLEYGCGLGSESFGLAAAGASVTAIDISSVAIAKAAEEARRRDLSVEFLEMDAEELTFDDASFDLVCGSGILHHLDLGRALGEVARVLRPDGHAVFMEPLGTNPLINLYRRATPRMRTEDEHPLVESDFDLAKESFSIVDSEVFNLAALAAAPMAGRRRAQPVVEALHRLDAAMFARSAVARRLAWVVVVTLAAPRVGRS